VSKLFDVPEIDDRAEADAREAERAARHAAGAPPRGESWTWLP
jgi:hypothetical protein